jgi:alpha,alpha-trehalase
VDEHFIVPGGRFREWYYWDSFWIIRGLLVSEMYETAKGITRNFGQMVKQLGFIPNGGRIYYTYKLKF